MFKGFRLKPFHRCGVDEIGPWVSGGVCEFNDNKVSRIKVYRLKEGTWILCTEEPPESNIELWQLMFAAEQMKLEKLGLVVY